VGQLCLHGPNSLATAAALRTARSLRAAIYGAITAYSLLRRASSIGTVVAYRDSAEEGDNDEKAIDHYWNDINRFPLVQPFSLLAAPSLRRAAKWWPDDAGAAASSSKINKDKQGRRITMRTRVFTISILFSLFVLLAGASTFAQGDGVEAKVPFDFVAGKKLLPAGEYTIKRGIEDQRDFLLIRGVDNQQAVFLFAEDTRANETPKETDLIFNKVGDEYFLSQVWVAGQDIGREIPKPRAERKLEQNLAQSGQPAEDLIHKVRVHTE
jgi:hypothetical protein